MAINYKLVTATSDASSPDTVFTATAVATHVKSVRIANESGGALTYHLAVYDNSATIEVPITVPATSLPDDDVDVMVEPFNLQNGDYIKLYSSGAGVKVAITLAENTDVAGATTSDDLAEGTTNLYLTSAERTKLSGIATGAEVNQNAFSNVAVSGQTTVAADAKTDTLTLVAGTGVTLTTDAGADSITIAASGSSSNSFETIVVAGQSNVVADSGTDTLTLVAGTGITLTTDAGADSVTITNSATGANAFGNVAVAGQTTVAADSTNDTLTIAAGTGISLTTDATTDTLTITNSVTAPNTFGTIAVATQSSVVADSTTDTLTFAVAGGMAITTNATTDTVTFDSARLDDDDVTLSGVREIDLNGENLNIVNGAFEILMIESDGVRQANTVIADYGGTVGGKITLAEATANGGHSIAIQAPDSLAATTTYTLPSADGTSGQVLATNAAGGLSWTTRAANSFETIAVAGQSSIVADTHTDTLTIAAGTGITLTTNATTDTLTITNSGTVTNTFSTIAVAGQSDVVADSGTDTLTLVAGSNITLTTNATTDTITIAAAGGSGSPAGSTGQIQYNNAGAFGAEAALHYDATNNRLSVGGNTSPTGTITSRGAGTTTGVAFRIEDSAAATRCEILDSGRFTLSSAAVSNTAAYSILEGAPTLLSGGFSLRRSDASHTLAAGNAQSTDTFFLVRTEAAPAVYATIMGLSASGQASPPATRWIGIHGSTAPTGAVFTMQGSKTNGGSGYTTLGNAETAWKFDNFATNLLVCLGSGAFGIRNSAPTSTTALTVRGQGTSTNNTLLVENSGGTARFTVRDDGGYAFAGGTVGAAQTGYTTFTNLTTDRTCDANATTVEELADILGTLIVDLKTKGIIAA